MTSTGSIGIVGGSLAGVNAARTLRAEGFTGAITVIGDEPHLPYDRPPLSKDLLTGALAADETALRIDDIADVTWLTGVQALGLDVAAREVQLDDGPRRYDGIVLATGARARILPGEQLIGMHAVRTLEDGQALAADLAAAPARVAVVGAGFIGCEIASVCRTLGLDVTVLEPLPTPLERVLGVEVGSLIGAMHVANGVELRLGVSVLAAHGDETGHVRRLDLSDGTSLAADVVVVAIGVDPASAWLAGSGLDLDGGIRCDETGQVAPGIVVAGDVACWPSRRRGVTARVEHWDNAIRQGAHAARRLLAGDAGAAMVYDPVPWFWSDQCGRKIQMLGSTRDHDEVLVLAADDDARRLLALYRRGDELAAVVGVNRARQMVQCRRLFESEPSWDVAVRELGGAVAA